MGVFSAPVLLACSLSLEHFDKGFDPSQSAAIDGAGLVRFQGQGGDWQGSFEKDILNLAEAERLGVVNDTV